MFYLTVEDDDGQSQKEERAFSTLLSYKEYIFDEVMTSNVKIYEHIGENRRFDYELINRH